MTISRIERPESGISCLTAFCETCRPSKGTGGKHLAQVHNGYGNSAEPISEADQEAVDLIVKNHDKKEPTHEIVIYRYTP